MHFIYDILFSRAYPFTEAPAELPDGVIADLHFLAATEILLTDIDIKGTVWAAQFEAILEGAAVIWTMHASGVHQNKAYPITDARGYVWGQLTTGSIAPETLVIHGASIKVAPSVILPPVTPLPSDPEGQEYSFESTGGIMMTLDQQSNVITFDADENEFTKTSLITEESLGAAPTDTGIILAGQAKGPVIGLDIEGMQAFVSISDTAIRIIWADKEGTLVWPGCRDVDVIRDALKCSVDDGSSYVYPLDPLICGTAAHRCLYAWDTPEGE